MKARSSAFRTALGPVETDLNRWHPGLLTVTEASAEADYNALVTDSTGSGTGVYLSSGWDVHGGTAHAIAHVAEKVQEAAFEALWRAGEPTNWPPCQRHPQRHPLEPVVHGGTAVWGCPTTDEPMVTIGELPGPERA